MFLLFLKLSLIFCLSVITDIFLFLPFIIMLFILHLYFLPSFGSDRFFYSLLPSTGLEATGLLYFFSSGGYLNIF